jgi:hypothetical protein
MTDPAEELARQFHETYEALAPSFNYKTRDASAVPWDKVPESNRNLMVAVCRVIISKIPAPDDAQASEARSRMWQNKSGALLALIETDDGDAGLFARACAMMNVNWRTGSPDDSEWDAVAMASFDAAVAVGFARQEESPDSAQLAELKKLVPNVLRELRAAIDGGVSDGTLSEKYVEPVRQLANRFERAAGLTPASTYDPREEALSNYNIEAVRAAMGGEEDDKLAVHPLASNYDQSVAYRIVPPDIASQLPPHPIEFLPEDTNRGRACSRCGFSVPAGYRHIHAEWCEKRVARHLPQGHPGQVGQ